MTAMEFQTPYFPPPFAGSGVQGNTQDFISHNISNDPYQQYAVGPVLYLGTYPKLKESWPPKNIVHIKVLDCSLSPFLSD